MPSRPTVSDTRGTATGPLPGRRLPVGGLLDNPVRNYDWGSHTVIAELLGHPSPAGTPQAELWMGAHPAAPSALIKDGIRRSLADLIETDPDTILGTDVVAAFGARLPFLLKLLAVERPLSLQVHPDPDQARRGYADEMARGVPLTDPSRRYGDDGHKPELVVAVSRFTALSGVRDPSVTARLLDRLDVDLLTPYVRKLRTATDGESVREILRALFGLTDEHREALVAGVAAALVDRGSDPEFGAEYTWGARLASAYPGDVGVVVALLLNLVVLAPGEGLHTPAGRLHAYLSGTAVEVMASSDNVLRAGLTSKYIDADELLAVADPEPAPVRVLRPRPGAVEGEDLYATTDREYQLSVLRPRREEITLPGGHPQILFCLDGAASLIVSGGERIIVPHGGSAFLAASIDKVQLTGTGTVIRATTGPLPQRLHRNTAAPPPRPGG